MEPVGYTSNRNQGTQVINLQKNEWLPISAVSAYKTEPALVFTESGWVLLPTQQQFHSPVLAVGEFGAEASTHISITTHTMFDIEKAANPFNTASEGLSTTMFSIKDVDVIKLDILSEEDKLAMWLLENEEVSHIQPIKRQKIQLNIEKRTVAKVRTIGYEF